MRPNLAMRAVGVTAGVAALSAVGVQPSFAHPDRFGSAHPINTAVFAAHPDSDFAASVQARINALATWAARLSTKVASIPSTTVVTGNARWRLEHKLARVNRAIAAINAASASTRLGLTDTQKAQLAAIVSTLQGVASTLTAVLANSPAVTPTPGVTTHAVTWSRAAVLAAFAARNTAGTHHCDGDHHFGDRYSGTYSGDRYSGDRYSGDRRWDGHR